MLLKNSGVRGTHVSGITDTKHCAFLSPCKEVTVTIASPGATAAITPLSTVSTFLLLLLQSPLCFRKLHGGFKEAAVFGGAVWCGRNAHQPDERGHDVGQTKQISTIIYPTSIDQQVTWTSSNPDVAEVSSSGLVTAKKTGSTTITARAVKNSAVYATCNIRVKDTVSSIYLQYSKYLGEQGESFTLSYELSPSDAYANVVWTSSNTSIATVEFSICPIGFVQT